MQHHADAKGAKRKPVEVVFRREDGQHRMQQSHRVQERGYAQPEDAGIRHVGPMFASIFSVRVGAHRRMASTVATCLSTGAEGQPQLARRGFPVSRACVKTFGTDHRERIITGYSNFNTNCNPQPDGWGSPYSFVSFASWLKTTARGGGISGLAERPVCCDIHPTRVPSFGGGFILWIWLLNSLERYRTKFVWSPAGPAESDAPSRKCC